MLKKDLSSYPHWEQFPYAIIDSIDDLFYYFRENSYFISSGPSVAHKAGRGVYIYRGHSNYDWEMFPSVFRNYKSLEDYSYTAWAEPTTKYCNFKDLIEYVNHFLQAEIYSVQSFLEGAEEQGVETGLDYQLFRKQSHKIVYNLKRILEVENDDEKELLLRKTDPFPSYDLASSFAFAQHYGVPTRFLDFTESPYIALFFASYNTFNNDPFGKDDGYMVINCLRIHTASIIDAIDNHLKLIKIPRTSSINLSRQKGVFVSLNTATSCYLNNKKWPSVEQVLLENSGEDLLNRLIIPKKMSREILRRLFDLDITPYSLMPSLENISQRVSYINKIYSGCNGYQGKITPDNKKKRNSMEFTHRKHWIKTG